MSDEDKVSEPVVGEVTISPNGDVVIGAPTAVAAVVLPEVSE
jgi:hypothetical protein